MPVNLWLIYQMRNPSQTLPPILKLSNSFKLRHQRSCPACGGTDHSRRTSKKCERHLPSIRKRNLQENEEIEVYVVKRGLSSALCPLLEPEKRIKLLSEIRRDVRDLSRMYIELGIWINYYMKTHTFPAKPDILNFLYAMKSGKPGPYADAYKSFFGENRSYDGKLRSFIVQEMAKQYETTLRTNITLHAYGRLARYFKLKRNDPKLFNAYFKKILPDDTDEEMRRICSVINVDTVKNTATWWSTVPMWIEIQEKLQDFRLFPQPSHGLKHLTYTSRGWHELLRRVDSSSVPSVWGKITDHMRELWSPWLNVNTKKFGCCLQTDGISVSLSMNRTIKKKNIVPEAKRQKMTYDCIVAVDPGSRVPVAAVDDRFNFKRITKKYVRSHTLEWKRERVRLRLTKNVLDAEQKAREAFDYAISSKNSSRVVEYTRFRMQWFDRRQEPYEKHARLARLNLDKYMRTARCEETIVREVFDGGGVRSTLILYGQGSKFMNVASFSGRKFRHDSLIRRLRSKRNIIVEMTNEAYTSQACSSCNERDGRFSKVSMNHRTRRGVCPNCRDEFDRDANAAKNILINYKRSAVCGPGCF